MGTDYYFFIQVLLFVLLCAVLLISVISLFIKPAKRTIRASLVEASNGHIIDISQSETSIGRAKTCDITFTDVSVSRFHAVLSKRSTGWFIFDTNSTCGVIVNDKKIDKKFQLTDGDSIRLGKKELIFYSTAVTTRQQNVARNKKNSSETKDLKYRTPNRQNSISESKTKNSGYRNRGVK